MTEDKLWKPPQQNKMRYRQIVLLSQSIATEPDKFRDRIKTKVPT